MTSATGNRTTETAGVAEKIEELRSASLAFPPNIRRKVNMALDGIEQAIAATLDGGKLTAEQVRKAIFDGSVYASYDGAQYYANGISMQAIADELNDVIK